MVQGRHAHAAAQEHGVLTAEGQIVAVAQSGEQIQLLAGGHGRHPGSALAHNLVDQSQGGFVIVADGNGSAQELPGKLNVYKLSRCGDGGGIAGEDHFVNTVRQGGVAENGENGLLHLFFLIDCSWRL